MEPIGTHGLACLDDTDWADYARYMQCQAEAIDATLFAQQEALEGLLSRPTILVRPSANRTFASGVTITDLFNEVEYINNTFMSVSTLGAETWVNIGSAVGVPAVVPYLTGMYLIGGCLGMDATGAVTVSSRRTMTIEAVDDSAGVLSVGTITDINPDMGTTIVDVHEDGNFTVVLRGISGVRVRHSVSHTNVASTVTIAANDARLWVTYLGPDELVEVA